MTPPCDMRNEALTAAYNKEVERSGRSGGRNLVRPPENGLFFEIVVVTPKPYSKELTSEIISPPVLVTVDLPPSILPSPERRGL